MDELQAYLKSRKEKKGYLFIPYHAFLDPDEQTSFQVVSALFDMGADTIEIGLPFSDAAADGPILQRSFNRILANNFTMAKFIAFLEKVHKAYPDRRLLVMGYINLFLQYGIKKLFNRFYNAGVRGVIIPDVPVEEKGYIIEDNNLQNFSKKISWIDFITPITSPDRLQTIVRNAGGFVYLVSYKGVTGRAGFNLNPLKPTLKAIRKNSSIPVVVGFGVRSREHVLSTIKLADGFIIASRLHEIIEKNLETKSRIIPEISTEVKALLP